MAYLSIRKLDGAVIGVNKYALSPESSASFYEINKSSYPIFLPHWSQVIWTYSSIFDSFTNTGLPMVWY